MTPLIDPEELPFTRDEIAQAAALFLPADVAAQMADGLASCGPGLIEARRKRRIQWRKDGLANADTLHMGGWAYPAELLPALAALSTDCAERANRLNSYTWDSLRSSTIYQEQRAIAQAAGMLPTLESLMEADAEERRRQGKRPRKMSGIVVSSSEAEWPAETETMREVAAARVAEVKAQWELNVAHFVGALTASARSAI